MTRPEIFAMRVSAEERQMIERLAQREERAPSDVMRRLVRREARALGLLPAPKEDRPAAQAAA